ncbi:biopolymer transporter ExbD [Prevotella scopos JCM 17725]|jgi:membrane protein|uniref:Biopolymer transport protein ExbD n=1 Tax=Prevotella scopos JCM 17725 TaxID=1236518 RepID=A0AAX2F6Y9_9BACT|nr:biopolymer transporter ExbD [Prevotella scopos]ANR74005.1 biopolymer transporter ExbD [Prevotella scopos JCM 17725]QUB44598.1 biopolymer transporter ExbD [Prevotella scopos JCM 17725]SHG13917.1 Biopolymer transport protein ExbD [Prevotella scopos JCM 17725]
MKLYRGRNHEIPTLNTASLPDLIFSILFFFMLVVHMRKATVHVKYQVPMATELSRMYNNSSIQHIYIGRPINKLGKVESNKMVVQLNDNITTIPEIKKYLIQLSAVLPPEQRKQLSVSIKADRHADMGMIMDLKQALREANVLNINFTATMSRDNKLK